MITISPRNFRYLEDDTGQPYIPIGPNLSFVRFEPDPEKVVERYATWIKTLAANGGNFFRIWISMPAFNVEPGACGAFSDEHASRIRRVLDLADAHGIKVKVTIDHFRFVDPEPVAEKFAGAASFSKEAYHRRNGGVADNMTDYLNGADGRRHFLAKLDFLARHLAGHPAIMAWELWNEMNAVKGEGWMQWTRDMLPELRSRFPGTFALQSLGGYERPGAQPIYREYAASSGTDLVQVHRYLNEKEGNFPECFGPVDVMAADAVLKLRSHGAAAPIFLAECGAVEPGHAGPFRLYGADRDGTLLHDVLFAGFFSGGAGPGHAWHWQDYIEANDLWWHYARFSRAIDGIDPITERFEPVAWQTPRLRFWALAGDCTLLVWARDRENDWQAELRDGRPAETVTGEPLALPPTLTARYLQAPTGTCYDPWTDRSADFGPQERDRLPDFTRSLVIRLDLQSRHP